MCLLGAVRSISGGKSPLIFVRSIYTVLSSQLIGYGSYIHVVNMAVLVIVSVGDHS